MRLTNGLQTGILATFIYVGPESEAREALAPFFDMTPIVVAAKNIPFTQVPNVVLMGVTEASCNTSETLQSIHTVNVRQFAADTYISTFEKFDAFMKAYPDSRASAVILETFSNHAALSVPDEDTAYPWRDSKGSL